MKITQWDILEAAADLEKQHGFTLCICFGCSGFDYDERESWEALEQLAEALTRKISQKKEPDDV